jgi:hypothetical protein
VALVFFQSLVRHRPLRPVRRGAHNLGGLGHQTEPMILMSVGLFAFLFGLAYAMAGEEQKAEPCADQAMASAAASL